MSARKSAVTAVQLHVGGLAVQAVLIGIRTLTFALVVHPGLIGLRRKFTSEKVNN